MAIEGKIQEHAASRIRLGMVGGGSGAFIGGVHRMAARLDDRFELVAGALASSAEKALASGQEIGLTPERTYTSYQEMAEREAQREDGIKAVSIVTPNHVHYAAAKAFLERGIHVICDKPLTATLDEAKQLHALAHQSRALFILTHNYTGYPMVRQAREMIANGELGTLRLVHVEYLQDWLTEAAENTGAKGAVWRTDPAKSGPGGSTGDIGTHAFNLMSFVSGLTLERLSADVDSFVEGRRVDDNAHVLLRFAGGAKGTLTCSQVAPGNENTLRLRIYGSKGGIEWEQEHPNHLWYAPFGEQKRLLTRAGAGIGAAATRITRIPAGHPEGYLEAFATLYAEAAKAIDAHHRGETPDTAVTYPSVDDGLKGVAFIDACLRSSREDGQWVSV